MTFSEEASAKREERPIEENDDFEEGCVFILTKFFLQELYLFVYNKLVNAININ